jgi:hypothetical protein
VNTTSIPTTCHLSSCTILLGLRAKQCRFPHTREQDAPFAAADRGTFATLTGSCSTEAPMPLLGDISLFTLRLRGTLMRGTFTGADCRGGEGRE